MLRRFMSAVIALLTLLVALAPANGFAQTASGAGETMVASVGYRGIDRPAGAPAEFSAPDGVSMRFLSITAIDGVTNTAAVVQPQAAQPSTTPLIIHIHGSGGNLYEVTGAQLGLALAQRGYASLTINTRQHDDAVNTDNFFDVRNDIAAAVLVARNLGYQRIVLHGHSLGTSQVLYYAATDWSPDIKGLVLTGPFANLPWKTQYILVHDDPVYQKLYQEALDLVRSGHPDAVLPDQMPYLGGASSPVTAQHFLTYRWQPEAANVSVDWIRRVTSPMLLVRDSQDQTILPFEPNWLYSAATAPGGLSPDVENVLVPDSSPGNGHTFPNTIPELTDVVAGWLGKHGISGG
jgi:pimeloyl-ACP methyl ester carboxylesterase